MLVYLRGTPTLQAENSVLVELSIHKLKDYRGRIDSL